MAAVLPLTGVATIAKDQLQLEEGKIWHNVSLTGID